VFIKKQIEVMACFLAAGQVVHEVGPESDQSVREQNLRGLPWAALALHETPNQQCMFVFGLS
jgi:hypothetical protein